MGLWYWHSHLTAFEDFCFEGARLRFWNGNEVVIIHEYVCLFGRRKSSRDFLFPIRCLVFSFNMYQPGEELMSTFFKMSPRMECRRWKTKS